MPSTLRMCTWNIQLGLHRKRIFEALEERDDWRGLDLLALQEASADDGVEDSRAIAAELGREYDSLQMTAHHFGGVPQANALVWNKSRIRLAHKECIQLPRPRDVRLSCTERLFLRLLPQQRRISVVAEGNLDGDTLRVYVAHLDVLGRTHKQEQFARILADDQVRPPSDLTILAGDLNTYGIRAHPSWACLSSAAAAGGFRELTSGIEWTHSLGVVGLREKLDAIFARCRRPMHYRAWTLDIRGSDHIPVFAEITLE